jgi:hypothetical protein
MFSMAARDGGGTRLALNYKHADCSGIQLCLTSAPMLHDKCRSSRFSRFSAFILSATSVGTPARLPLSTSAFFTHSFNVCAEQPIFAEIDMIACQRELYWP